MSGDLKIGFVGVGTMGGPMANQIKKAGFDLGVYDSNAEVAQTLATEIDARCLSSIKELAEQDVIVCMLPTGHIVREVLMAVESGAFLKNAKPGTIVVDMSSSEPTGTQELAKQMAEQDIILVDAPVSGGAARAQTGELTIMIGGDDKAAIEKVKPLLSAMGANLFDTGASGSGHATKALNNFIGASSFVATSEAIITAKRFGLDLEKLVDIVNVSTGHTFISDKVMKQHVLSKDYATNFALGLMEKDVTIALGLVEAMGVNAPMCELVKERWATALDELGYNADNSEAIKVWELEGKADSK